MEPVSLELNTSLILAAAQNQFSAGLAQPERKLFGTENQGVQGCMKKIEKKFARN